MSVKTQKHFKHVVIAVGLVWLAVFAISLIRATITWQNLVFDEVHYVPAATELFHLNGNLNYVHPPFAKWMMGASIFVWSEWLSLMSPVLAARLVSVIGALILFMLLYIFSKTVFKSRFYGFLTVIITLLQFLWFGFSFLALLEIPYLVFSMATFVSLYLWQTKKSLCCSWLQCVGFGCVVGLALASKWSSAPVLAASLFMAGRVARVKELAPTFIIAIIIYILTYMPMAFFTISAGHPAEHISQYQWHNIWTAHQFMFEGQSQIQNANFAYASPWYRWIFFVKPMWLSFEQQRQDLGEVFRGLWAGENFVISLLFVLALPVCLKIAFSSHVLKRPVRWAFAVYLGNLIFWALLPRNLMMFNYYLPSSYFVGFFIVAAIKVTQDWMIESGRILWLNLTQRLFLASLLGAIAYWFYCYPLISGWWYPMSVLQERSWFAL